MSDDRRKNARLQGRFSSNSKLGLLNEKKSSNQQNSGKNKGEIVKNLTPKSTAVEGINLEYQEKSNVVIPELAKKKPEELRTKGFTTLSTTENGISQIYYAPDFMTKEEAEEFKIIYERSTPWEQKNILIHGKEYPQPREVAWYGDLDYSYSGATLKAAKMTDSILQLKNRIEGFLASIGLCETLNSVLLNRYRDEHDSVAWHSDDELSMGVRPTIASISLGEIREFHMRPKQHVKEIDPNTQYYINLLPGSLLVMTGSMQLDWQHQVPKASHNRKGRINLTFRHVFDRIQNPMEVPCLANKSSEPAMAKRSQPHLMDDPENFPPLGSASSKPLSLSEASKISQTQNTKHEDLTESNRDYLENENRFDLEVDSGHSNHSSESAISSSFSAEDAENDRPAQSSSEIKTDLGDDDSVLKSEVSSSVENGSLDNNTVTESTGLRAHQFNVNAPDFVPSTAEYGPFSQMSLKELVHFQRFTQYEKNPYDVYDFWSHLEQHMCDRKNEGVLSFRDYHEVDVYFNMVSNGLNVENQKLVNARVCFLLHNGYKNKSFSRKPDFSRKSPRNPKGFNKF